MHRVFNVSIIARPPEAQELVELGDVCTFVSDTVEFGNGMLKAKAIGSNAGRSAAVVPSSTRVISGVTENAAPKAPRVPTSSIAVNTKVQPDSEIGH